MKVDSFEKLMQSLEQRQFNSVYFVDGEEPYYLDIITDFFSRKVLSPSEQDFNLITLFGKDSTWQDVVNACRRFPMFAERQVVILREATQLKDLNALVSYIEKPSPTTVFLIEHRFKKVDGRSKLATALKGKNVVHFTSEKIKDDAVPAWIQQFGKSIRFQIGLPEAQLLTTFLGGDLQRIANEIEKIRINVPEAPALTSEMIQKYIGISREYNVFDFPATITTGNRDKMIRMLHYFLANPKVAAMPMVIGTFTHHLTQLYTQQYNQAKGIKAKWMPPDIEQALGKFSIRQTERAILVVAEYSARAVGIDNNANDTSLLKEMIGRLEIIAATP